MNTKLTLRLDGALIRNAKVYARREGKSLSQIVAGYFGALSRQSEPRSTRLGPVTSQLRGVLKGKRVEESDYRKHLEKKHG
jgi:hypothetical protein